ncbi:MAG: hypothetical protein H7145_15135 [Akkermansiaceae bacterium]|nr:hypothetical protein [Armatimonadota bacterium]
MHIVYPVVGLLLGLVTALVLHRVTGFLRLPAIVRWVTGLGWYVFAVALSVAVFLIAIGLSSIGDPLPGMNPLWGMLGVYLLAFLGVGAWTGVVQARHYGTTWVCAFGIVMAKYALAVGLMCLLAYFLRDFGDPDTAGFWYTCCVSQLFAFMALEIALP